jgi:ABC-type transport system substrate-binding protein
LLLLAALVAGSLSAGCRGGGGSPTQTSRTLRVAVEDDLSSLDPALAFDTWSTSVVHACTRRLVDYDATGKLVGDLATEWSAADGGKTYTFTLREARYSDGTPIEAAHFKAALERVLDDATASPGRDFYTGITAIEAPDPRRLVIRLAAASPTFLKVLGMTFAAPLKPGASADRGPGSGPYFVKEYAPGARVVLARNPHDPGNGEAVDEIVLQLNINQALQVTRLKSGEVDLLPAIPPQEYDRVMGDAAERARVVQGVVNQTWYFGMDTSRRPFDDPRVRRAALLALNHEQYARLGDGGEPAVGVLPPKVGGFRAGRRPPARNLAEARRLLAAAGYPDGIPESLGVTLWLAANERYQRRGELLQSDLAEAGIRVQLRAVAFSEYRKGYRTQAHCWYGGWYPDFPDAGNFLEPVLHSRNVGPGKSNAARYRNPAFDALLDRAARMEDGPARDALYAQADALLAQDLPWLPLSYEVETRWFRPGVTGVTVHPVWRQMLTGIGKSGSG